MRSEEAAQQLIPKWLYDKLAERHPLFMATCWVKLWKQWFDGYVRVYQCKGSGLATRLNAIDREER